MSVLAICRPLPLAVTAGAGSGAANLASENPREAFVAAAAGAVTLTLDLGYAREVDTVFVGFTTAAKTDSFVVVAAGQQVARSGFAHSYREAPLRHGLAMLPAPITTRYLTITVTTAAPLVAGVIAVGRSIRPFAGHEWGSGRPITDTSQVERLLSGGLGINRGMTAGGWQWTMSALSDEERDRLYALALDVGIGGTILVLEDIVVDAPDVVMGANEGMHWSVLTKLEPYARQQPGEAKWSVQVQDWA